MHSTTQGGGAVNGPTAVVQGGTITVSVGPNDTVVEVKESGSGASSSFPVEPGKDASIPVPNVPGGTYLTLRIGNGTRMRTIVVEVIAPGP